MAQSDRGRFGFPDGADWFWCTSLDRLSAAPSILRPSFVGGADRDRTGGLLVANQALSQLSYSPIPQLPVPSTQLPEKPCWVLATRYWQLILVGLDRLELSTSPLSGVRSSHLSYRPGLFLLPSAKLRSLHYISSICTGSQLSSC